MRTRSRYLTDNKWSGYLELWKRNTRQSPPYLVDHGGERGGPPLELRSRQVTSDVNHKIRGAASLRGSTVDVGGPFDSVKSGIRFQPNNQIVASKWGFDGSQYGQYRCVGPVLAVNLATLSLDTGSGLRKNLVPLGTTAIARCKPTNHVSDLANDLAEILEGQIVTLPGRRLWEGKTLRARSAGDEYLNIEFGWLPLTSDMRDASYAIANAHRLMKSYEANSGKKVRRSYEFPPSESASIVDLGPSEGWIHTNISYSGGPMIDGAKSQPHLFKQTKTYRSTWFAGSFTYYIPSIYKSRNRLARIAASASHLLGLELTPDVVWQVTPWTWAVDWFSNLGDVVSNASDWAVDGLVLNYGYIMEHVLRETVYSLDRPSRYLLLSGDHALASPVTVYYESKRRLGATPFGFETNWSSLSLRQLAIAGALGLKKGFS